jgi:hypothetical protein
MKKKLAPAYCTPSYHLDPEIVVSLYLTELVLVEQKPHLSDSLYEPAWVEAHFSVLWV